MNAMEHGNSYRPDRPVFIQVRISENILSVCIEDRGGTRRLPEEPGCRRFDVLEPTSDADRILLYEIYDSRQAFEAHLKTPHLATFEGQSAALVRQKIVTECNLACEGSLVVQEGGLDG